MFNCVLHDNHLRGNSEWEHYFNENLWNYGWTAVLREIVDDDSSSNSIIWKSRLWLEFWFNLHAYSLIVDKVLLPKWWLTWNRIKENALVNFL